MKLKGGCYEEVNHGKIVFEENRSKLTLINDSKKDCKRIKVDNCQIVDGLKCDFALFNDEIECYIELKGQDINKAFRQLMATIKQLSANPQKTPKISFVICARSPLASAEIQNMRLKFRKEYNSELLVKTTDYKHSI